MELSQDVLKEVVRRVAEKLAAIDDSAPCACTDAASAPQYDDTPFPLSGAITERKVTDAFESGHRCISIGENTIITPSARDYIYSKQMKVIRT